MLSDRVIPLGKHVLCLFIGDVQHRVVDCVASSDLVVPDDGLVDLLELFMGDGMVGKNIGTFEVYV